MFRKIENLIGVILMLVASVSAFCGNLNCSLGLGLLGLALYLPDEEICADATYKLFKRKSAEIETEIGDE